MPPWPAIGLGLSLLGKYFGGGNKAPTYQGPGTLGIPPNSPLYQYLLTGMLPGSDQPSTSSTSSRSTSVTDALTKTFGTRETWPTYHYGSKSLVEAIPGFLQTRLSQGGKLGSAEKMGVVNQIGRQAETVQKGLENRLLEMGLYESEPIRANVEASVGQAKTAGLADFATRIPEIERQRSNEDMALISNVLNSLFKGSYEKFNQTQESRSTTNTSGGSTTTNINPGGTFDPSVLQYLIRSPQGGSNVFGALGSIGGLLAALELAGVLGGNNNNTGPTGGGGGNR